MRTIKFRGKCKKTGEWVYGNYHHCTDYYGTKIDKHYISEINSTYEHGEQQDYEIIPETLGQYIGLKDIHTNKEIYEGDLVKRDGFDEVYEIRFYEEDFGFKMYGLGKYGYHYESRYKEIWIDIEIIGDIYENKEYSVLTYYEDIEDIVGKKVKVRITEEKELISGTFEKYEEKYKFIFDKEYDGMNDYPIDTEIFEEKEDGLNMEYIVATKEK